MMSIGAIRLLLDALSREGGRRSLVLLLGEAFEALERAI
jgi:hypothetical protein